MPRRAVVVAVLVATALYAGVTTVRLLTAGQGYGWGEVLAALPAELAAFAVIAAVVSLPGLRRARLAWPGPLAALLAVQLSAPTARPAVERGAAGNGPRTVVLVTLDTTRRDHVSAYPDAVAPDLTPRLDALAREGTLFLDAVAPAPLTLPSHTSMLSGRPVEEHGVVSNDGVLPADLPAAPEVLAAHGYRTGAFVSSAIVLGDTGLARGFEVYRDALGGPETPLMRLVRRPPLVAPGDETVASALRWLARVGDDPVFLWVHLYDPHAPHEGHDDLAGASTLPALGSPCRWADHPTALRRSGRRPYTMAPIPPSRACDDAQFAHVFAGIDAYAREVRFADQQLGVLLDGLAALDRGDAAIVVVADHGESLVEHQKMLTHQLTVYDPVVRVPLIVRAEAVPAGRVEGQVSIHRVAATLLAIAGVPPSLPGEPLPGGPDALVSAVGPGFGPGALQVVVRGEDRKVLLDEIGHVERYDLATDPDERLPRVLEGEARSDRAHAEAALARQGPAWIAEALERPGALGHVVDDVSAWDLHLDRARASLGRARAAAGQGETDPGVSEALRALGYTDD